MLVGTRHCYRLFVIPLTTKYLASNEIIRYCIINEENINEKQYLAERNDLYYRIIATNEENRDRVFYGLCLTSRNIHVLEIRRGVSKTVHFYFLLSLITVLNFRHFKSEAVVIPWCFFYF